MKYTHCYIILHNNMLHSHKINHFKTKKNMKYLSFFSVFFAAILLFVACANKDKLSKEDSNKNDTLYGLVGHGTSMPSLHIC